MVSSSPSSTSTSSSCTSSLRSSTRCGRNSGFITKVCIRSTSSNSGKCRFIRNTRPINRRCCSCSKHFECSICSRRISKFCIIYHIVHNTSFLYLNDITILSIIRCQCKTSRIICNRDKSFLRTLRNRRKRNNTSNLCSINRCYRDSDITRTVK